jgi:hypothetical protein
MESGPQDKKKKPYVPPHLSKLTREQAVKLTADRTDRSHQEAAEFLDSLRHEKPPHEEKRPQDGEKHPPNQAMDEKRKRSA